MRMENNSFGLHSVTPVIIADDLQTLINFILRVFSGKSRGEPQYDDKGRVRHAEVLIGDSVIMMSQPTDENKPTCTCMYVYVTNCDAVYKRALLMGATSMAKPSLHPHGDKLGGVIDPLGNMWWIVTHDQKG